MASTLRDLSGKRFGNLIVLNRSSAVGEGRPRWRCLCDCGTEKLVMGDDLRKPKPRGIVSCGCIQRSHMAAQAERCKGNLGNHRIHGASGNKRTPEYGSWAHARDRCNNPNHHAFKNYGGRGITFCKRWDNFQVFLVDMGPRPTRTTLDRIEVNGNYEPINCRWATYKQQSGNRRKRAKIH